jgi:hypothetical protein
VSTKQHHNAPGRATAPALTTMRQAACSRAGQWGGGRKNAVERAWGCAMAHCSTPDGLGCRASYTSIQRFRGSRAPLGPIRPVELVDLGQGGALGKLQYPIGLARLSCALPACCTREALCVRVPRARVTGGLARPGAAGPAPTASIGCSWRSHDQRNAARLSVPIPSSHAAPRVVRTCVKRERRQ